MKIQTLTTVNPGVFKSLPVDAHVVSWIDDMIKQTNFGYSVDDIRKNTTLRDAWTKYSGETGRQPAQDYPTIKNSILNINLSDGSDGANGVTQYVPNGSNGESLCCTIAGIAVDSEINITCGIPGNGGNGYSNPTSYAGTGGNGGHCLICLRSTFSTRLVRAGVTAKDAMTLLRHSDANLTLRVYAKTNIEDKKKAFSKLPNLEIGTHETTQGHINTPFANQPGVEDKKSCNL